MIRAMHSDLNEPCCPDVTKRVCFECRENISTRLAILAHNLAVAGSLEMCLREGWAWGHLPDGMAVARTYLQLRY